MPATASQASSVKPRRRSFRESQELQSLETELPRWETRRRELEQLLAGGSRDYAMLELCTTELATLNAQIEEGEDRWLELSELAN